MNDQAREAPRRQPITRRRFLKTSALLGVTVTGLAAAACAPAAPSATPTQAPQSAAPTQAPKPAAATAAPAMSTGQKVQLRFWHQEAVPKRVQVFQKFIDAFNKEMPDVEVTQESQGWDVAFTKLVSALKAGNQPDVMLSLPALTMTFQNRGDIIPVDDIVAKLDQQYKFVPSQLTPFKYKDATWGVPMWGMVFLWHYRTDAYPQAEPPKTWGAWLDAAKAATKEGKSGVVLPANKNLFTTENLYSLMISGNAHVYGPDGKIAFNSKETVETLGFYKDMLKAAGPSDATSYDWGVWEQSLLRGVGQSTIGFSSWRQAMEETPFKDGWGAAAQPAKEGGKGGQIHYPNNLMIFKSAETKKDAIGRFAEFLHRPENNGEWLASMEPTLYIPITDAAQKSNSFWDNPVVARHKAMVQKQLEVLPNSQLYGFQFPNAYNPSVGELEGSGVLGEIVQKMVVDDLTPQAAAEWGQTRLAEVLKVV